MKFIGDNPPNEDDINYFGLQYACQSTRGNFALYKEGAYAARGRVGTSPLYWNREKKLFSFFPHVEFEDFPPGHLYNFEYDRIVCWDSMYFDKPLSTNNDVITKVELLFKSAVRFLEPKVDGFLLSAGCGSRMIDLYLNQEIPSYTVSYSSSEISYDVENMEKQNRSIVYFDETSEYPKNLDDDEIPMYILARHLKNTTNHKKFICGLGCYQLFSDSNDFRPYVKHIVDQFAKFGLEIYSPFFDCRLMEYVLDMTSPEDRRYIMTSIIGEDDMFGLDIHQTVGFRRPKKKWWYF